jgi:PAS domain S-box-containing protein
MSSKSDNSSSSNPGFAQHHQRRTAPSGDGASRENCLDGGGELGERMRQLDWAATPLGPPERWPQSLKTAVRIILASRQPFWIGWGDELTYLYNDAYKSIIGGKHPQALGQPTSVVWREIWNDIEPLLSTALSGAQGTYVEAQRLIMERHGYPEETYYTFSYSPIPGDDGRPGGIICANSDDTRRVIGERQVSLLRELGAHSAGSRTLPEVCERLAQALATNPYDLPFAMLYLLEPGGQSMSLAGASGIRPGGELAPPSFGVDQASPWPFGEVLRTQAMQVVAHLDRILATKELPTGAWQRAPSKAAVVPIAASGATGRAGVLVAGLNPFRLLDDGYRGFLSLVAGQISASIGSAEAFEQEKRRAEALAEIDRAKTTFFSNVSHELRTPLTLMLGPVEDALAEPEMPAACRERLQVAQRNSQRLLKLVNSLLDFSRIEAGRVQANYEPTELGPFTGELASGFRSAIERAGMKLIVDCRRLSEPVYVDREMWEKLVLNLVSNAFKYTHEGQIEVALYEVAGRAELSVRDTGIGIPEKELPHLFERFHRVEGARGRTQEGTGIGLALVQELVKLHGGTVRVAMAEGKGSTFTVSIPLGHEHLPAERMRAREALASTATSADAYVEEALRWLPESGEAGAAHDSLAGARCGAEVADTRGARILLADDNADMRLYMQRLLAPHWHVEAVADGQAALDAARRQPPDLILTDVMMPRLDGFGLLREVRADERLRSIPVIVLSARAGEESSVEGLAAGADDYLVKPFSARELLARVHSQLAMSHLRREGEERVRRVLESIADGFQVIDRNWRFTFMNAAARRMLAEQGADPENLIGKHIWDEAFPAGKESESARQFQRVMTDRVSAEFENFYEPWKRWYSVRAYPVEDGGIAVYFQDITQRKELETERQQLLSREAALRQDAEALYEVSRSLAGELDLQVLVQKVTDAATRFTGAQFGAFFYNVINEQGEAYLLYTLSGAPREAFDKFGMPRNTAVFGPTFEGADVVRIDDVRKDPRYGKNAPHYGMPKGHLPVVSYLAVPVISRSGIVLGGLFFGHSHAGVFTERAERLAVGIAAQAAIAIDNARLFEQANREIAERKAAEHAIMKSEGRFRALVKASSYVIYRMSPDWTEMLHLDGASFIADTPEPSTSWLQRYIHPDDQQQVMDAIQRAIRTKSTFELEHRVVRVDGSLGWTLSRAVPLLDEHGEITEWFGAASDVTDRKQFEQELAAETRVLEKIVTGSPLTEVLELLARTCEEQSSEGMLCSVLLADESGERLVHGAAPSLPEEFNRAMSGIPIGARGGSCGAAAHEKKTVCVTDIASDPRWESLNELAAAHGLAACCSQPILSSQGRVLGTVAMYYRRPHDPSQHERQLIERAAHLAGIVIERTRAEDQIKRALEAEQTARAHVEHASRLKDEFLATLSHELRTPLNAIMGWSQLLRRQRLDGQVAEGLAVIERNSRVQVQLVEDLLDMSRIISGKLRIDVQRVEIAEVINAAVESVRPASEAKEIRLQAVLDHHVGPVRGDPARLQQVVWNLLINAIKFTPKGGKVQLALERVNSHIEITVMDTGEGIPPDFLPYVFDRFRQADAKTTRRYGGLGLGLAIVKNLVEAHGGKVRAKSPGVGKGATFSIELPLMAVQDEGVPNRRREHPTRSPLGDETADTVCSENLLDGVKVLVVDDEQDARDLVRLVLEDCHAKVVLAGSAAEGYLLLRRERPDVLLSDIGMPGEDGYEFIRRVRMLSSAEGGDVPAAALTAFARSEDRRRALMAGYQSHIAKPVEPAELVTIVASLAGKMRRPNSPNS